MKTAMILFALVGCSTGGTPEEAREQAPKKSPVERGKLIAITSGCHDCHTPWQMGKNGPEPDMSRALSGHPSAMVMPPPPEPKGPWITSVAATNTAWSGPWGVSFTANLTLISTIRNGKHMGVGRPLLPPMPAPWYAQMSDDDLKALYAYLQSLPAIKNKVPEPLPPAPAQVSVK
jgi:hypothetical protein